MRVGGDRSRVALRKEQEMEVEISATGNVVTKSRFKIRRRNSNERIDIQEEFSKEGKQLLLSHIWAVMIVCH